jgi:hypothetical protein
MFSVHQLWLLTRSRCVKHWRVPRSWPFLLRVSMHGSARFIWIGLQVLGNAIGRCGVELRGALKSGLAAGRSRLGAGSRSVPYRGLRPGV